MWSLCVCRARVSLSLRFLYNNTVIEIQTSIWDIVSFICFHWTWQAIQTTFASTDIDYTGRQVKITGWGRLSIKSWESSRYLRQAVLRIMSWENCRNTTFGEHITRSMLCAYNDDTDACQVSLRVSIDLIVLVTYSTYSAHVQSQHLRCIVPLHRRRITSHEKLRARLRCTLVKSQ
jgi:hypothetical protein